MSISFSASTACDARNQETVREIAIKAELIQKMYFFKKLMIGLSCCITISPVAYI
jgi:hypothetical protein